jgi:hypothetical protein
VIYAVLNDDLVVIEIRSIADSPIVPGESAMDISNSPEVQVGWKFDPETNKFSSPAPAMSSMMTHLYFLSRMTREERIAIRTAAQTDPILNDAMMLFERAREVNVSLSMTQQLVGYLAMIGLLQPERVPVLLAPAPTSDDGVLY